jgi:hypothetical protein
VLLFLQTWKPEILSRIARHLFMLPGVKTVIHEIHSDIPHSHIGTVIDSKNVANV